MKFIYTGKQIKSIMNLPVKSTHTATAQHAFKKITAKYGSVQDDTKYRHIGAGNWQKVSALSAAKLKKPTGMKARGASAAKLKKLAIKKVRRLNAAKLKRPVSMKARGLKTRTRTQTGLVRKGLNRPFSGLYRDVKYTIDPGNRVTHFKWDFSQRKGYYNLPPSSMLKLPDVSTKMNSTTKSLLIADAKKSIDIIHRGVENIFSRPNRNLTSSELREATRPRKAAAPKPAKKTSYTQQDVRDMFPRQIEVKHPQYVGNVIFNLDKVVMNSYQEAKVYAHFLRHTYYTKILEKSPRGFIGLTGYGIYVKPKPTDTKRY